MTEEAGRVFCEHLEFAWHVALSAARDAAEAEDVVQDAYLNFVRGWAGFDRSRPVRPYLARAVANASADRSRAEARRSEHHTALARERGSDMPERRIDREQAEALHAALRGLEPGLRMAVALRHLHGLSLEETAEALELPRATASDRVHRGLERLHQALSASGFGALAAPAALAALSMPAVPATLAAALEKMAASGSGPGEHPTPASTKGGLLVKIGLGMAALGLTAGTALWAAGGLTQEPGAAPATAGAEKPKFDIPIWHPDVQWSTEKECIGGSGLLGHLQGPQREIMRYSEPSFSRLFGPDAGNQPAIYSHDPELERVHTVAGGAAGYLDGPFSRARFGGWSYGARSTSARSPNGRFVYFTEPYYGKVLRQLDLKEQRASTVSLPEGTILSMASDDEGNLYTLMNGGTLLILDTAQGKVTRTVKLDPGTESIGYALSWSTTLDTVNGRLYATKFGTTEHYIWYWDIKDGSFHGVLALPKEGEAVRPKPSDGGIGGCLPGPFLGTKLYNEGSVYFGPDDPGRRFLYTSRVDTDTFFRLDLEKKELWVFAIDKEKKMFRFIGPGETGSLRTGVKGLNVLEDGGLMSTSPHWEGGHVFVNKRRK